MFFTLSDELITKQKTTSFPGRENVLLSTAIVDNYGSNYLSVKLSYTLQENINKLKVFNNLSAKKMMNFRIFEINSQEMYDQLPTIKNLKELNKLILDNKVYHKDVNAALSFVGDVNKLNEHYIKNNNLFLNYNFDFFLTNNKPTFLSFGCVFFYDPEQYSIENNIPQEDIVHEVLFGFIKSDILIDNNKPVSPSLKDLRIAKGIFEIDRLYDKVTLKNTGVRSAQYQKKFIPYNQYFSDLYITKKNSNELSMLFNIDFHRLVLNNSPLKDVMFKTGDIDSLLNQSHISSIQILRKQVKKFNNTLKDVDNTEVDLVITSEDQSTGLLTSKNNDMASIKESTLNTDSSLKLRTVQVLDKNILFTKKGSYQYGIKLTITDGLIEYLYNLLDQLLLDNNIIKNYLSETDKIVSTSKSIRDINPHILQSTVIKSGNYDPLSSKFSEFFIYETYPRKYEQSINTAISRMVESLQKLGMLKLSKEENISILLSLLNPSFSTAQTINYFIKLHSRFIEQINSLLKTVKNNNYNINYWFANETYDVEENSNNGYNFIEYDDKNIFSSITDNYLDVRTTEEITKYSKNGSATGEQLDKKYGFLSPIGVSIGDWRLDLDKLLEEKNEYPLQDYKNTELAIKRYNLLNQGEDKEVFISNKNTLSKEYQKNIIKNNRMFEKLSAVIDILEYNPQLVSGSEYTLAQDTDPYLVQLGLSKYFSDNEGLYLEDRLEHKSDYSIQNDLLENNNSRYFENTNNEKRFIYDLDMNSKYLLLYSTIHQIEYLSYADNVKNAVWKIVDKSVYDNLVNTRSIFCRLKLVDNPYFKHIDLSIFNKYFILNYLEGEAVSSRRPYNNKPDDPPRLPFTPTRPPPPVPPVPPVPPTPPKRSFNLGKAAMPSGLFNTETTPTSEQQDINNSTSQAEEQPIIVYPTDGATPDVPGDIYDAYGTRKKLAPGTRYSMYESQYITFGNEDETILLISQNKKYRLIGRKYGLFLQKIEINSITSAEYGRTLWEISAAGGAPSGLKLAVLDNVWEMHIGDDAIHTLHIRGDDLRVTAGGKEIFLYKRNSTSLFKYTNKLVLQNDGNLVFYNSDYQKLWATNTDGGKISYAPQNYKGKAQSATGDNITIG